MFGHCPVEVDVRKYWTNVAQEVGFDFVETCLDTAGLKLMLEEG